MLNGYAEMYLGFGVDSILDQIGIVNNPNYRSELLNTARIGAIDSYNSCSLKIQSNTPGLAHKIKTQVFLDDGLYSSTCLTKDKQYEWARIWTLAVQYADKKIKTTKI